MAYEDFTTYTEFDEGNDVTVDSATKVSWANLISRKETAYLYKDYGVDYFSGDFTHKFEVYFSSMINNALTCSWVLANIVGDLKDIELASGDGHALGIFHSGTGGSPQIKINFYTLENGSYVADLWSPPGPQVSTLYFIEIVKDDDGGANSTGRLTAYIRTGSHSGALQDTLIVDCSVGEQNDFRYVYALSTYDDNWSGNGSAEGYTQNLDLGGLTHYTLIADSGGFTITGTAASLLHDKVLSPESGAYAIVGSDAILTKGLTFSVDSGSFVLSGQDVELRHNKILSAESGSFIVTGSDAAFLRDLLLSVESGSFVIIGQDANLSYMPIIQTDWKANKDLGPWGFTEQSDKWGYLNNPRWSSQANAQAFCKEVGLSLDSPEHHLPCGHWHKQDKIKYKPFPTGKWVAAMPQPDTPYIYLYDITYKAVIKLKTSIPPVVTDVLSLESLYTLNYDRGEGNPGAQRGGYCINKDGTRLWYLFRDASGDCQLIEVDISGTMNIVRKTTFSNLVPGEHINDGCSDDTHTYWCTTLVEGRIIKIRNSDHSIIDDHLFNYEVLACSGGAFDQGIITIDVDQSTGKLYWIYCRDHTLCSPPNNACRHIIRANTDLVSDIDNKRCHMGGSTPGWQNMIRIHSGHILQHRAYHPSSGILAKRDLETKERGDYVEGYTLAGVFAGIYTCIVDHGAAPDTQPVSGPQWGNYWRLRGTEGETWMMAKQYYDGEIRQEYLQNIFGVKNEQLFTLMHMNSFDHPAYLYCIDFIHIHGLREISKKNVSYYAGQKYGDYDDWSWTSVSAMSEQTGIIIIVRWNHVEEKNYVASFSADSSLELLSDVPLYSIEKRGNIDKILDEPQVWTMEGAR